MSNTPEAIKRRMNLLADAPKLRGCVTTPRLSQLHDIEDRIRKEDDVAQLRDEIHAMSGVLHSMPSLLSSHLGGALTQFEQLTQIHQTMLAPMVENQQEVFDVRTAQMQQEINALRRQVALLSQIVAKLELNLSNTCD